MSKQLEECIQALRISAQKPRKFEPLRAIYRNRQMICFLIHVGQIGVIKAGFDNHRNHNRPHIHFDLGKNRGGRISLAINDGSLFHKRPKRMDSGTILRLQDWISRRRPCLEFMYNNIQNLRSQDDFQPLLNAINKYIE